VIDIKNTNLNKISWFSLGAIVVAATTLVWLAPTERTLGQGIKVVYVHVGLTWAGMVSFSLAGLLGIGVAFTAQKKLQAWTQTVGWAALLLFAMGFGMSIVAAKVNWGDFFWDEPRMMASLQFLLVALIVQMVNNWLPWYRGRGLLSALLATFLMFSILGTPLVLHPESPIRASSSLAIKLSFLGMFILSCLTAAWLVWYFRKLKRG
jgi:hypothetical protein